MKARPAAIDLRTESVRAALLALYDAHDGLLAPTAIVEAARDPDSPLHDEFEWDDDAAAEAYRLAQAGGLIRRIRLHVIKADPKSKKVTATVIRQFQSRPSQRHADGGYESVQDIFADPIKRGELLHQVLREMNAYRKRYAVLSELQHVWQAIDDAREALEVEPKSSAVDRPGAPPA